MSPAALELARRLAAHPRWTWRRGARELRLDEAGTQVGEFIYIDDAGAGLQAEGWRGVAGVPDLDNPATCGCLLAMLHDATVTACVSTERLPDGWLVGLGLGPEDQAWEGSSLGEALALALLALWGPA